MAFITHRKDLSRRDMFAKMKQQRVESYWNRYNCILAEHVFQGRVNTQNASVTVPGRNVETLLKQFDRAVVFNHHSNRILITLEDKAKVLIVARPDSPCKGIMYAAPRAF